MSDLPYYCHVCHRVIYIEDQIECPYCKEAFLELYVEDADEEEDKAEEEPPCVRSLLGFSFFGCMKRPARKEKTISSDRRNYAIGPEIDDIISRLRDERGVEENPATEGQKRRLRQAVLPETEACSICFCLFEKGQRGYRYPCDHHFHKECSDAWLRLQSDCPLCRTLL